MMQNQVVRYNPDKDIGLTDEQINERKQNNLVNYDTSVSTKSIKKILFENLFTVFNFLNLGLAIAIISVNSYKNLLFLGIVFCNVIISIVQEIYSKKKIDKLSIISAIEMETIRNSKIEKVKINEILLDDILILCTGNQIVTDCIVVEGTVEVNESFITGEPDNILKEKGDMILSGSFVISGKCKARVDHIGSENYTSEISNGSKYIKKVRSEMMLSLNKIIKFVTVIIIPIGILLFFNQLNIPGNNFENAVVNTVAAMIGMIPEGLVLLISTVLAVSTIRLSKRNVLVQNLYCIETLARVNTLCLDKTGTITENKMEINNIIGIESKVEEIEVVLSAISKFSEDNNGTIEAIKSKYRSSAKGFEVNQIIPFSSSKKWSGISFKEKGSYILGSPEFVLGQNYQKYANVTDKYVETNRILVLAHSNNPFINRELPDNISVMGFLLISNKIRKEAYKTIKYFKEQGVNIKIISGDNPKTVSIIAKAVGLDSYDKYIDATTLKNEQKVKEAAQKYSIFGRVTPIQKKQIIKALKECGNTVAMTGDGVNDVLAMQESDCAIAVASGSEAARNVAQLVLLDSNFDSMPEIVAEGRRTINNVERSATLFLSKTIYATILAFMFLFLNAPYPFMPIHLTLISVVAIGIPSFILALEPNKELVKGKFLTNVIKRALPSALTVIFNIVIILIANNIFNLEFNVFSTICVIATGVAGLVLLKHLCTPRTIIREILFVSMCIIFVLGIIIFKDLLSLSELNLTMLIASAISLVVSILMFKSFKVLVNYLLTIKRKIYNK